MSQCLIFKQFEFYYFENINSKAFNVYSLISNAKILPGHKACFKITSWPTNVNIPQFEIKPCPRTKTDMTKK